MYTDMMNCYVGSAVYMLWCVAIIGSIIDVHAVLTCLLHLHVSASIVGLRAKMGAGFSRMNDLTIIQTTQVRGTDTMYSLVPRPSHCLVLIACSMQKWRGKARSILSRE